VLVTNPVAQPGTTARRVALFVLGMPRSGTSALTRILSLCGGTLPSGLMGAVPDNPLGRWEPRASLVLNYAILRRHGSGAYDPTLRLQEEGAFDADENAACIAEIGKFLTTLPAAPLVVIKDLHITVLSDVWFEAAHQAGFDIAAVIAVRHPEESIRSLAPARVSPQLGSALWLKYNLLAERRTLGLPRVFIEYANLLDNWRWEIKRISAALPIDLKNPDEGAIDKFLTQDLRHQRHRGPVTEPFGTDWISVVYETLRAVARDEPWDQSALDRVFEAYRASEHGFRTVFNDYRRVDKRRLVPPSIVRLGLETLAMAHRRRGTWA
jgi:hypothetical protein